MIKVSIIVPLYNVEPYLGRCMKSLLNQTIKGIEIIMVDDDSPDRCPQMCEDYKDKYPNIKVVHKKNGGLGFARNSGLEVAEGEYVAFIDSDDFVDTDMFQNLYEYGKKKTGQKFIPEYSGFQSNIYIAVFFDLQGFLESCTGKEDIQVTQR